MLRRLRQGVKAARRNAARDEKIARPFRCALRQDRCLDFEETLVVEIIAGRLRNAMAEAEVARELRAAQVEIAISQAQIFIRDLGIERERKRLGPVENRQARGQDFDLARSEIGIFRAGQARRDPAFHLDDIFVFQMMRGLRDFGIFLRAKDDLGESFAIAQIDENDAAVIAPGMDPAGEFDLLADVGGAKGVAIVGAIHGRRAADSQCGERRARRKLRYRLRNSPARAWR